VEGEEREARPVMQIEVWRGIGWRRRWSCTDASSSGGCGCGFVQLESSAGKIRRGKGKRHHLNQGVVLEPHSGLVADMELSLRRERQRGGKGYQRRQAESYPQVWVYAAELMQLEERLFQPADVVLEERIPHIGEVKPREEFSFAERRGGVGSWRAGGGGVHLCLERTVSVIVEGEKNTLGGRSLGEMWSWSKSR
jgi:hypothetical protein